MRPGSRGAQRTTTREPPSPPARPRPCSRSFGEFREVRFSFLHVRVAAFLRLFAHVVEERRVARELLDAGEPVVGRIESGLEHAQRERTELERAPAPRDRLAL